jgi:hypothetical protein
MIFEDRVMSKRGEKLYRGVEGKRPVDVKEKQGLSSPEGLRQLFDNQKDLPPEYREMVDEKFWELI